MLMMISNILITLTNAYSTIIFIYVLMSWLPNTETGIIGQIYRALGTLCDPYLDIFRRFIPPIGVIDISPIIALLVLQAVVEAETLDERQTTAADVDRDNVISSADARLYFSVPDTRVHAALMPLSSRLLAARAASQVPLP